MAAICFVFNTKPSFLLTLVFSMHIYFHTMVMKDNQNDKNKILGFPELGENIPKALVFL